MPIRAGRSTAQIRRITVGSTDVLRVYEGTSPTPIWTTSRTLPPAAPSAFTPALSSTRLALSWTAVPGATGYRARYWRSPQTVADATTQDLMAATQWTLTAGLAAGQTWNVQVQAYNAGGNGPWSATQSLVVPAGVVLPAPVLRGTSVVQSRIGPETVFYRVNLSWASVAGALSYQLQRRNGSNPWQDVGTGRHRPTTRTYEDVQIWQTTRWRVRASLALSRRLGTPAWTDENSGPWSNEYLTGT